MVDSPIYISGSGGFIGRYVLAIARTKNIYYRCIHRYSVDESFCENNLSDFALIHLAGRAHVLKELSESAYEEFAKANCDYAVDVALSAAKNGLKRFVYVSSVGVYGKSYSNSIISENTPLAPIEDYAKSKLDAERKLTILSKELGFELVIVRPALVYGFDAPGNIERLLKLTAKLPVIPIAEKCNKRSFVYVENLVDFLLLVAMHPKAAGKTFNIADEPISTHDLINNLAKGMGLKRHLFAPPRFIWELLLRLTGKKKIYEQLFEDLVLDMSLAEKELGWQPKHDTVASLQETGKRFIEANAAKKPRE
ncbi:MULTISPECIES: NAD-dependent epimerase/dehydratase family protein [Pseudidiomarina]|nr:MULTISPECIES: NAD-dependent epimerase/dehydratase family protein [Pseudidiomarina]